MNSYFGSKATSGLCQAIISMMPPHSTYIESHLGGGAIMKKKTPAQYNIGIDIDPLTIQKFTCDYPVHLVTECAHRFLSSYSFDGSELVYCDPPYLLQTRTSNRRYRFDYSEKDHQQLIELLKALPCNIILSGYPSSYYNDLLNDWNSVELQVMNQSGVRTEKLWFNYEIGKPYWIDYAGKNFTDRQRIKRKAQRWGENYKSLPKAERLAVLSAIMRVEAHDLE